MGRWKPPVFNSTEEYSKWAFHYVKKLARIVPSLSIASIVIRLAQLALMIALSLAYAAGSPGVYHDVLIWEKNVSAPYQVTVYRNFTSWGEIRRLNLSEIGNTAKGGFIWNSNKTYPGCERYTCDDTRWDCNGSQWQSSRVGFGDSEGFNRAESPKSIYALDRAIFGMVVTLVSVSAGHTLYVLTQQVEPSGVDIYRYLVVISTLPGQEVKLTACRYIAGVDIILAMGFTAMGILPVMWSEDRSAYKPPAWGGSGVLANEIRHHASHQHDGWIVICLGWALSGSYLALFIINVFLIANLEKFAPIADLPGTGREQLLEQIEGFGPQSVIVSGFRSEWSAPSQASTTIRRVSGGQGESEAV